MAIATLATEAKAVLLHTEARRCIRTGCAPSDLTYGGGLGQFMKDIIDQLESATVNSLTARTDIAATDDLNDGRDATEGANT